LIYIILLLFGLYILGGMILSKRQDLLIFDPTTLDSSFSFQTTHPYKEFNLKYNKNTTLNILYFPVDSANGQILYFHDFSGNINTHLLEINSFLEGNKNVFILDYPGYGKSTGTPSEKIFYNSADILYKLATNYLSPDSTIICGEGTGSAVAAYLSTKEKSKKLILLNPIYQLSDVAQHYFPIYPVNKYLNYNFDTSYYVKRTHTPITVIYNKKDYCFFNDQAKNLGSILYDKDTFIDQSTH